MYNFIIFILLCMNYFKFLYLNNLPITKKMAHNSNLLFLLNYLKKKKIILSHIYKFKKYLEIILGFFLEHISIIF
jgi:hypothetical protein